MSLLSPPEILISSSVGFLRSGFSNRSGLRISILVEVGGQSYAVCAPLLRIDGDSMLTWSISSCRCNAAVSCMSLALSSRNSQNFLHAYQFPLPFYLCSYFLFLPTNNAPYIVVRVYFPFSKLYRSTNCLSFGRLKDLIHNGDARAPSDPSTNHSLPFQPRDQLL